MKPATKFDTVDCMGCHHLSTCNQSVYACTTNTDEDNGRKRKQPTDPLPPLTREDKILFASTAIAIFFIAVFIILL